MRDKNGFIATSVLYAFLIAFLTLFLGFMADYIQNKQLIRRIEDMAKEDLENYGELRISDLEIGDTVVFDTIDDEGDGSSTNVVFSSPISPNAKWILFDIESDESENTVYYFVSSADAQKKTPISTAINPWESDASGPSYQEIIAPRAYAPSLATVSQVINGNVYYDNSTKVYRGYDSSVTNTWYDGYRKVFTYQFLYSLNGGVDVRFLNSDDLNKISSLDNERIKETIYNQNSSYTIWNSEGGAFEKIGFYQLNRIGFDAPITADSTDFSNYCTFASGMGYAHRVTGTEKYDYCYYSNESTNYIGMCTKSSDSNKCNDIRTAYDPRYVAMVKVKNGDNTTDGFIDSGNGTTQLPYLITKGAK